MDLDKKISRSIEKGFIIEETNFQPHFKGFYRGKVRDNYMTGKERVIVASDRLSAFDRILTCIPYKGQILNQTAAFWFEQTKARIPNHVLSVPDPNIMIAKECKPLPVEMVIRGYITGSAWRSYEKDQGKPISGTILPKGLKKNETLNNPIITPTTKAEIGNHDEDISREEIIEKNIVAREILEQMEEMTYKLFELGTSISKNNNLILVDTKYEFGLDPDGQLVVIDEIHTPDSSRFWVLDSYQERFNANKEPDILDKEFVRNWLRSEKNFMGDGPIPKIDDDIKVSLCKRYINNYEIVTGKNFDTSTLDVHPITRITEKLRELGYIR
nr:phosphoribosylaminoimidazolesuccinocarboxamide synthase [Candidatus Sigynarchaeota archaeon]